MSPDPAHGPPPGPGLGPEAHVMVGNADLFVNWARKSSLWYLLFATACCGIELMQAGASRYDMDRFGAVFRATSYRLAWWFDVGRGVGQVALAHGDLDPAPRAIENFLRFFAVEILRAKIDKHQMIVGAPRDQSPASMRKLIGHRFCVLHNLCLILFEWRLHRFF